MNVLVTGGAGYIGPHCCKELAGRGFRPVVFDNLSTGHRAHVAWGELVEGDTANTGQLAACFARHRIEAVMHFAALIEVGESVGDPLRYYRNNVMNTIGLLEAMHRCGIRIMVFSSSAAVYGNPEQVPIAEDHPTRPINPYGWTKLMVETMLADCERAHGLTWAALRYFNAAGADAGGVIGENHTPESHLIPRILQAAANGSAPVRVFGTDYPTADGTCVRDYVHVTDLARAHVLALEHLIAGKPGGCFNLGQGCGFSVMEVIRKASEVTGRDIGVEKSPRRPGDPPVLIASNQKARQVLGWSPRHSSLQEILSSAWRWHQGLRRYGETEAGAPLSERPARQSETK